MARPTPRWIACGLLIGCHSGTTAPMDAGAQISMHFDRSADFYSAPFPSDDLLQADGHLDLSAFPNPQDITIASQSLALLTRDARGFSQAGGVFFKLSADLDTGRLPSVMGSIDSMSSIALIGVDKRAPDYLKRYPIEVSFEADGGPFGTKHLLSLLPLQGIPLRSSTRYAAVVLRKTLDVSGHPLGRSPEMALLASGQKPTGMNETAFEHYRDALAALATIKIAAVDIAGLAVFTTDAPTAALATVVQDMLSRPLPVPTPFIRGEVFDTYCVYNSTLPMPDYQEGTPPFSSEGGDWTFDASGKPVFQRTEEARLLVTIPRVTAPGAGLPNVVLIRTGAGGDRPLVDRGLQTAHNAPSAIPGSGPAQEFARVGFAGVMVDGPLGGVRNTTHGDEQFLTFNIFNPAALRDNVRESAAEIVLLAHVLKGLVLDVHDCPGATAADGSTNVRFDPDKLALMGHSMGASIAPLVLAQEPSFKAVILSGAGASYIENVMDKREPVNVKAAAELVLQYDPGTLKEHDPVLSLLQWAAEPSDSQVYARRIIQEPAEGEPPRHVLMLQGIVDNYIRPRIANGISLSLGLDLAGAPLDAGNKAYTAEDTPLESVLTFSGRSAIGLPATGNVATAAGTHVTAVVVQHPEDGVEDGHEDVFQTEPPKNQYRCFLQGFGQGRTPTVPTKESTTCP
jgi:hypothetical protein